MNRKRSHSVDGALKANENHDPIYGFIKFGWHSEKQRVATFFSNTFPLHRKVPFRIFRDWFVADTFYGLTSSGMTQSMFGSIRYQEYRQILKKHSTEFHLGICDPLVMKRHVAATKRQLLLYLVPVLVDVILLLDIE